MSFSKFLLQRIFSGGREKVKSMNNGLTGMLRCLCERTCITLMCGIVRFKKDLELSEIFEICVSEIPAF